MAVQCLLTISNEAEAVFVPAGLAWQRVRQEKPDFNLYNPDEHHPGMHGAYLTVSTLYAVLTGKSPEGHPRPTVLNGGVEIERETALYLQKIAWERYKSSIPNFEPDF